MVSTFYERQQQESKVLGTGIKKVNDHFTLNDVALVDRLRYNLLSISQLIDADLSVLFCKSDSHVLGLFGSGVCGISRIGNVFQADFFTCSIFFAALDFIVFFQALEVP
jgi:hypothetical protein